MATEENGFALAFTGSRKVKALFEITGEDPKKVKSLLTQLNNALGLEKGAVEYMLSTGFARSMAEGGIMTKEEQIAAGESLELEQKSRWDKRFQDIKTGGPSGRSAPRGPRVPTLERTVRDVAMELLKAKAAKEGKALPKGKELTAYRDNVIEANRAKLETLAKERMAQLEDLTDLSEAA